MGKSGQATKYPGVQRLGDRKYRVRGKVIDPRTGKEREVDRILKCSSAAEAARQRAELLVAVQAKLQQGESLAVGRVRVGEYAQLWMKSKALKLDEGTASRYADALDLHVLPALGDFFYDALTWREVQAWVDNALVDQRTLKSGKTKPYSRESVHGWFRVLRTMTRDAVRELELRRDPTIGIAFPEPSETDEPKSISSGELRKFLRAMWERYPQHYALTAVLSFTGLRFCHASALKWEDWDEEAEVLQVRRKQIRGRVGPISRKKRAPRTMPVLPELAVVLRLHRDQMVSDAAPGLADGWMFPSSAGTLRVVSSVDKAWRRCMEVAGIDRRFTVHGLRYTFSDVIRPHGDPVTRRKMTQQTEAMQAHYSHIKPEEMRAVLAGMHRDVPLPTGSGDEGGDRPRKEKEPDSEGPETGGND